MYSHLGLAQQIATMRDYLSTAESQPSRTLEDLTAFEGTPYSHNLPPASLSLYRWGNLLLLGDHNRATYQEGKDHGS